MHGMKAMQIIKISNGNLGGGLDSPCLEESIKVTGHV